MIKKRRRKKKFRWLNKTRRWLLTLFFRQPKNQGSSIRKKRRKKKRKLQSQSVSIKESLESILLLFKSPKPKRRRRKRSLSKRIHRHWLNFFNQIAQRDFSVSRSKKRRRKRRSKQYAVYVMSNQKKVN